MWPFKKRNWVNMDAFEGRETSSGVNITETVVMGIPAVYACIRVLAESIAALPLITYARLDNGDKERARDFSLYPLLHDSPNPLMTSFEFRELLVGHLCLRGNSYSFIERENGEVVALWPLHPDKVTVEVSGRELIYKHQNDGVEKGVLHGGHSPYPGIVCRWNYRIFAAHPASGYVRRFQSGARVQRELFQKRCITRRNPEHAELSKRTSTCEPEERLGRGAPRKRNTSGRRSWTTT